MGNNISGTPFPDAKTEPENWRTVSVTALPTPVEVKLTYEDYDGEIWLGVAMLLQELDDGETRVMLGVLNPHCREIEPLDWDREKGLECTVSIDVPGVPANTV